MISTFDINKFCYGLWSWFWLGMIRTYILCHRVGRKSRLMDNSIIMGGVICKWRYGWGIAKCESFDLCVNFNSFKDKIHNSLNAHLMYFCARVTYLQKQWETIAHSYLISRVAYILIYATCHNFVDSAMLCCRKCYYLFDVFVE